MTGPTVDAPRSDGGAFTIRLFQPIEQDVVPRPDLPASIPGQRRAAAAWTAFAALSGVGLILRIANQGDGSGALVVILSVIITLLLVGWVAFMSAGSRKAKQRADENSHSTGAWSWPDCTFLGPFDSEHGLGGAHTLLELHRHAKYPLLVTLGLRESGFECTSRLLAVAAPGRGIACSVADISTVDLVAGSAPDSWVTAMLPRQGWRVGQVRIVTRAGKQANFSGVRLDHLSEHLERIGGHRLTAGPGPN